MSGNRLPFIILALRDFVLVISRWEGVLNSEARGQSPRGESPPEKPQGEIYDKRSKGKQKGLQVMETIAATRGRVRCSRA